MLRPGLVFGADAGSSLGGLFGAMVAALSRHALAPMVGGGWQRLFVTHDEHLRELVEQIVSGSVEPETPVFAAHEVPTTLRAIAVEIARAHGRRLTVIALAAPLGYLGLRAAELAGVPLPFRSGSLRSLVNPIPLDQVAALAGAPIEFPPLIPELWMAP